MLPIFILEKSSSEIASRNEGEASLLKTITDEATELRIFILEVATVLGLVLMLALPGPGSTPRTQASAEPEEASHSC